MFCLTNVNNIEKLSIITGNYYNKLDKIQGFLTFILLITLFVRLIYTLWRYFIQNEHLYKFMGSVQKLILYKLSITNLIVV